MNRQKLRLWKPWPISKIYLQKMVMFQIYVSLPQGKSPSLLVQSTQNACAATWATGRGWATFRVLRPSSPIAWRKSNEACLMTPEAFLQILYFMCFISYILCILYILKTMIYIYILLFCMLYIDESICKYIQDILCVRSVDSSTHLFIYCSIYL